MTPADARPGADEIGANVRSSDPAREARYAEAIVNADPPDGIMPRRVEAWLPEARAVMAVADAELASLTAERDEALAEIEHQKRLTDETVAEWSRLYHEAVGVPASEHQQRRTEQIAQQWEAVTVERDALRAEVRDLRAKVAAVEAIIDDPKIFAGSIRVRVAEAVAGGAQ